jgi:hypothetical protein
MGLWQRSNEGAEPIMDRPVGVAGSVGTELASSLEAWTTTVFAESAIGKVDASKSPGSDRCAIWFPNLALLPVRTDTMGRN